MLESGGVVTCEYTVRHQKLLRPLCGYFAVSATIRRALGSRGGGRVAMSQPEQRCMRPGVSPRRLPSWASRAIGGALQIPLARHGMGPGIAATEVVLATGRCAPTPAFAGLPATAAWPPAWGASRHNFERGH